MRILHTADWHLGDRLGRIDRTDDLKRGVERIAAYCESECVDALIVAGDLFSEMSRPDDLRDTIGHLRSTFGPFLGRGGTILAVTGNHDNETFCETLRHALGLGASGEVAGQGGALATGRLHLADTPLLWRLADRDGGEVQFVMMPYPSPSRYFDGEESHRYTRRDEKNRALRDAFAAKMEAIRKSSEFRPVLPSVLVAHIHVDGARVAALPFRMSERDTFTVPSTIGDGWAYVALGHIHHAQCLNGRPHVRYSGGLDRLDQGERDDERGAVVFDLDSRGLVGSPRWLPLDATPMLDLEIRDPTVDLPIIAERHGHVSHALVRYRLTHKPGRDDLDATLGRLEELFPRWHDREIVEDGADPSGLASFRTACSRVFMRTLIASGGVLGHGDRLLEVRADRLPGEGGDPGPGGRIPGGGIMTTRLRYPPAPISGDDVLP